LKSRRIPEQIVTLRFTLLAFSLPFSDTSFTVSTAPDLLSTLAENLGGEGSDFRNLRGFPFVSE